jgi:hypothetical protein
MTLMADTPSPADTSTPSEPVVETTTTSAPESTSTDATDASSSEAPKGETKETLLEAVMKAVKPDDGSEEGTETPPASETAEGPKTDAQTGERKGPDLSKDPTPEELQSYKQDTRKRIEQLLSERNSFRAEADVTRTLREFLVVNDIAREDFQLTLDLAAAMRRGDFKTFLEGIGPYVQLATQALGITLPTDLQSEVQTGRVSYDAAAQMSRDRYARALAEQRAGRATQVLTNQQTQQQQAQFARSIEHSVTEWENTVRQADPDYARKEATVQNFLWAVVREQGPPQSPEHAVQIAREAYARANNTLRAFAPQLRGTRPVPSSVNRSGAPTARAEPKTMTEAALLGLERARR